MSSRRRRPFRLPHGPKCDPPNPRVGHTGTGIASNQSWRPGVRILCESWIHRGRVAGEKWSGDNNVRNHHVKILLALYALDLLMCHCPCPGFCFDMDKLFLFAEAARNGHGDMRPLWLSLRHGRPPATSCIFELHASNQLALEQATVYRPSQMESDPLAELSALLS